MLPGVAGENLREPYLSAIVSGSKHRDADWSAVEPVAHLCWEERNLSTWEQFKEIISIRLGHSAVPARLRNDNTMTYTGTILSIDREPTIGDLLVEILTAIGYIADTAPDDASALAATAHYPPA